MRKVQIALFRQMFGLENLRRPKPYRFREATRVVTYEAAALDQSPKGRRRPVSRSILYDRLTGSVILSR